MIEAATIDSLIPFIFINETIIIRAIAEISFGTGMRTDRYPPKPRAMAEIETTLENITSQPVMNGRIPLPNADST